MKWLLICFLLTGCVFVGSNKIPALRFEIWTQNFYHLKPFFIISSKKCIYINNVHKFHGQWYDGDQELFIPEDKRFAFYKWIEKWEEWEKKYGPIRSSRRGRNDHKE